MLRHQTSSRGAPAGLCGLFAAACLFSAAVPAGEPDEPPPRLSEVARVRLVLLPTSVTNRHGKPVRDLEQDDFRLVENGEPREIDLFATEQQAPIALAFLVDVSSSMGLRDRLGQAKEAVRFLTGTLDSADRVALIRFSEGRIEWVAGFDEPRATLLERLDALEPSGRTALYDALAACPRLVEERVRGRKAIVLITDGVDNASDLPQLRATWMARRVPVPIYTIGFLPMREKLLSRRALEALRVVGRFSNETGGALFGVHRIDDLERAAQQIQDELRFQYVIGFYERDSHGGDAFRRLGLTTVKSRLIVRTRSGYYPAP